MIDLSIIYYTSNYLDEHNPYFLLNTRKQLIKVAEDLPLVIISQKQTTFHYWGKAGQINKWMDQLTGRSHLNIYRQILEGCKLAKTKYVAMAEDDILYSWEHFHSDEIQKHFDSHGDVFLYDMNKVSLFTWTNPPIFSFRSNRKVVNSLIAPREMLIEALEERFARVEVLKASGWSEEKIIKHWGDPGRYEDILGVTVRPSVEFYSHSPSIVFSHPEAFGFLNQGTRKRHGDIKIVELADWGRAEDVLKLYRSKEFEYFPNSDTTGNLGVSK